MEYSFHYLLMANQAKFHRGLLTELRDSGLTIGQPKVLDYLNGNDGASQKDIARGCHVEPASLTAILNGMEEKGLIERRMLNGNRRTTHIYVTEKGREIQKRVAEAFLLMEETAFSGISQKDRDAFMGIFERVYENLLCEKGEMKNE